MKIYLTISCLLLLTASSNSAGYHRTSTQPRELFVGDHVERELGRGQSHRYQVKLDAAQFLKLAVAQMGIDVVITIETPSGQTAAKIDSPLGTSGTEAVFFIAPATGTYHVIIAAPQQAAPAGKYDVRVLSLTTATARDKAFVAAKTLTAEAEETRNKFTTESLQQAMELYPRAIALWKEAGEVREEAYATHGLGRTQEAASQYVAASETYQRALSLWQAAKDVQGEAMTLSNLGLVYSFLADYPKAQECLNRALPLRRAAGDNEGLGFTLISAGALAHLQGESAQAIAYIEQALASARQLQQKRLIGIALYNLAQIHHRQNNLQLALDYEREAWTYRQQLPNGNERALTLNHLGELHYLFGDFPQAMTYFAEALKAARGSGNRRSELQILESFGLLQLKQGDWAQAQQYFEQALQLAKSIADRSLEAIVISELGDAQAAKQAYPEAIALYQQSLQLCRTLGNRQTEADVLFKIGNLQALLKNYDTAVPQLESALQVSRALKRTAQEIDILFALAQTEAALEKLAPAQTRIEAALALVESARRSFRVNDLRAGFLASRRDLTMFYVDLLMRRHKAGEAGAAASGLLASEQFRARSLLDLLAEARAEIKDEPHSAVVAQERELRQKISDKSEALTAMVNKKVPPERRVPYEKELATLIAQWQEMQGQVRAQNPRYAALTQPQPLTVKDMQQLLDDETVLLEYLLGKERSYLWVVSKTALTSYELPPQAIIEATARRVNDLFTRSHERALRGPAQLAAAELSQLVLAPAARQISGKRLLIVSDGALQYVPFAALPVVSSPLSVAKNNGQRTTDHGQPLIVNHEIVNLPSASVLPLLRQAKRTSRAADNTVAIVADPVFELQDQRLAQILPSSVAATTRLLAAQPPKPNAPLTRSGSETGVLTFSRLPYTRQEAEAIAALAPQSFKALDFQASRATVTNADLASYRILHFATHGLLNSQHPELSGLVLSLVDEKGQPQDGFLRLHDIYNLKLSTDLVVLSACRTGLGKEIKGEGLIGLTRGFMYAGAKSVIASVWDVKDEATAELMKRFYQNLLQKGQRPAAALRAAQLSIRQEARWAAPYFWAGFTMQGEWQ